MTADIVTQVANQVATQAVSQASSSPDPMWVGLSFVLAVVILVVAIARPIMNLFKDIKQVKVEDAKTEAESTLYDQLQGQILANTTAISMLENQRTTLLQKTINLEGEVRRLQIFEGMVADLKQSMAQQQATIDIKDKQIIEFMTVILQLKDQVHKLELRLLQDERDVCLTCSLSKNKD